MCIYIYIYIYIFVCVVCVCVSLRVFGPYTDKISLVRNQSKSICLSIYLCKYKYI